MFLGPIAWMVGANGSEEPIPPPTTPYDQLSEENKNRKARMQLGLLAAGTVAIVAAPALYSISLKRKKRGLTSAEARTGITLENASTQATGLLMTSLAAPAISTAVAYILVQKLEDAAVIKKGLGDAVQALLTVAAAGPAIQGIGQIAGSAFKKG